MTELMLMLFGSTAIFILFASVIALGEITIFLLKNSHKRRTK
jgi:hypothetical protein